MNRTEFPNALAAYDPMLRELDSLLAGNLGPLDKPAAVHGFRERVARGIHLADQLGLGAGVGFDLAMRTNSIEDLEARLLALSIEVTRQ